MQSKILMDVTSVLGTNLDRQILDRPNLDRHILDRTKPGQVKTWTGQNIDTDKTWTGHLHRTNLDKYFFRLG